MKTIFYEVGPDEIPVISNLRPDLDNFVMVPEKLSAENLATAQDAEAISVFINSMVNKEMIDRLPNLKFITTRSMGFDHIDVKYAQSKGIQVANVPSYGTRTVAEFAFSLMLGLSRKSFLAYNHIKSGHDFDFSDYKGFNLFGKTLGVIGTGRIGMTVVEIAIKGFQMKVVAYDPFPNDAKAKELGFSYTTLDELLPQSDIVTIHVPYNPKTHHLINASNIRSFKPGALLINTARGEVIETEAILTGIKENILAGVGLDVLEGERDLKEEWSVMTNRNSMDPNEIKTLLEDHILIDQPRVAITPHIAFFTEEAKQEILKTTVENLKAFAASQPINLVKS